MPQFDLSTFASQIFWTITSFVFVFTFYSLFFVPFFAKKISNFEAFILDKQQQAEAVLKKLQKLQKDIIQSQKNHKQLISNIETSYFTQINQQKKEIRQKYKLFQSKQLKDLEAELMQKVKQIDELNLKNKSKILNFLTDNIK